MDLFNLVARLSLDSSEYEKGIANAGGSVSSLSSKWKKAGAVIVGAVGAATVAVGALTKSAVQSYADYEQLAGGVKKLYGDAADEVMKYAEEGYKTSGLSANKYMELATSFSASLINSLDGDSANAAEQTDVAMRAISDNWNTFGGDLSNIQMAYQGFSKQNFTMLDNLKLGYGGTKTEMERLIADANEYAKANGMAADLSVDSFSDIVTAIDLIQQKQGIAGTTAKEAATTISGSLNMTKAAWDNLVAGFANPDADIGELAKTVMDSVGIAAGNVVPAVMQAIEGIGQGITETLPQVLEAIPTALDTMVTPLLNTGIDLVMALVQGLISAVPSIVSTASTLVTNLMNAISSAAPGLLSSAGVIIGELLLGIAEQLPNLLTAGIDMIASIIEGFASGETNLLDTIGDILLALFNAFVEAAPELGRAALKLLKAVSDAFTRINWLQLGLNLMRKVLSGMRSAGSAVVNYVRGVVSSILTALGFSGAIEKVSATFESIKTAISDKIDAAKQKVSDAIDKIKSFFPFNIGNLFSFSVPSISIGSKSTTVGGKTATAPSFDVGWTKFAKAMATPFMFTKPTVFNVAGDAGDEILYGRSNLMRDIKEATSENGNGVINIYLNYDASNDATELVQDIAKGIRLYRMAGIM